MFFTPSVKTLTGNDDVTKLANDILFYLSDEKKPTIYVGNMRAFTDNGQLYITVPGMGDDRETVCFTLASDGFMAVLFWIVNQRERFASWVQTF
jgi:hypothetical protein